MNAEYIIAFVQTLLVNAWYAPEIGKQSRKYDINATPSDKTFRIWAVIYYQLLGAYNISRKWNKEIQKSFFYNRQWIYAFVRDDIKLANRYIKRLDAINQNLKQIPQFELYAAWVEIASVLNQGILTKKHEERDLSLQYLYIFLKNKGYKSYIEAKTYVYAIDGILETIEYNKLSESEKKIILEISEIYKSLKEQYNIKGISRKKRYIRIFC